MSSEIFASLQIGVVVDMDVVGRVLNHKPYVAKSAMADVVLKGKVVGQTEVPIRDESTEQSWTVDGKVYHDIDKALDAFCGPLKISWGYAAYCGEIPCVWFAPYNKSNGNEVSFDEMAKVIKEMPRVREVVKRVFGLEKLDEGVFAVEGRE